MCTGCMVCAQVCPQKAIAVKVELSSINAYIDDNKCIGCGLCYKKCQVLSPVILRSPIFWSQGWSKSQAIREKSSSGGYASAIAHTFIEMGGSVCSCIFSNGGFGFQIATSHDDVNKFSGSKYVKSDPLNVYLLVEHELLGGKKCLFIGLPCQVAGVQKYIPQKLKSQLYTIDLICHGTPSVKVLDLFLNQHGYTLNELQSISFRHKNRYGITSTTDFLSRYGTMDCYSIAFLNMLTYTENCYHCNYAKIERVGDITLGDSWGSELPKEEQKQGVSLILCQTEKGRQLIQGAETCQFDVNLEKSIAVNHQLEHPSVKPDTYDKFFSEIQKNKGFDYCVWRAFPQKCFRQFLKRILIRAGIIHSD